MAQKKKQKLPKISLGLCCYCCGLFFVWKKIPEK